MKDTIEIPLKEYEELIQSSLMLECLTGCGVDNWCGYDDAMELFEEWEEK